MPWHAGMQARYFSDLCAIWKAMLPRPAGGCGPSQTVMSGEIYSGGCICQQSLQICPLSSHIFAHNDAQAMCVCMQTT